MSRATITIKPKALPGDRVIALNYRKNPMRWENGVVDGFHSVEAHIHKDGSHSIQYTVILLRSSATGKPVRLYVGDDKIQFVGEGK